MLSREGKMKPVTSMKRVKGFTLIELVIVMGVIATMSAAIIPYQEQVKTKQLRTSTVEDFAELSQSYRRFYAENRRNPTGVAELVSLGYYTGVTSSPFGSAYKGASDASGKGFVFTLDTGDNARASVLSSHIKGDVVGNIVSKRISIPSIETIASHYLARQSIAGRPELNQLETTIDANGNDLVNINTLDAQKIDAVDVNATNAVIDVVDVIDEITFGTHTIRHTSTQLVFDSPDVSFTNDIKVAGDIIGSNSNVSGINTITANVGQFDSVTSNTLTASTGNINTLTGNKLNYVNGVFTELNTETLSAISGTINNLTTITHNTETLNAQNVNASNAVITKGNIATLKGTSLDYTNGTVLALTGNDINYAKGTFTNLIANGLTANSLVAGRAVISNVDTKSLKFTNGVVTNLTANTATYNTANINELTGGDVVADTVNANQYVGSSADITNVDTTTINTTNLYTNLFEANTGIFDNLTVDGQLTTASAKVNGALNMKNLSTNSANVTNFSTGTLNATTINGGNFTGNRFNGTDFSTNAGNSVNNNKALADALSARWADCVAANGCQ
jgi:prepilin-type N-terminal cleavage/methylation domain-containing protein